MKKKRKRSSNRLLRQRRTRAFFEQEGLCFYCQKGMVLYEVFPCTMKPFDELCTLEHLESRNNPNRGKYPNMIRRVAACFKCNNEKGTQEIRELNYERQMVQQSHLGKRKAEKKRRR